MLLDLLNQTPTPGVGQFIRSRANRSSELSSVSRAVLEESGYSVESG